MTDCVSLEIAKKLKEAGWKQESLYLYGDGILTLKEEPPHFKRYDGIRTPGCSCCSATEREDVREWCAAPTIGSLLAALPKVHPSYAEFYLNLSPWCGWDADYRCFEPSGNTGEKGHTDDINHPADALAELWMALKERGIV